MAKKLFSARLSGEALAQIRWLADLDEYGRQAAVIEAAVTMLYRAKGGPGAEKRNVIADLPDKGRGWLTIVADNGEYVIAASDGATRGTRQDAVQALRHLAQGETAAGFRAAYERLKQEQGRDYFLDEEFLREALD